MRCDGKPVRLGMRTTRKMSRASQPDKQNGTLSVHTIKASGHVHRTNRPNTRLHPTTMPNHQINPCNAGAIHTGHSLRSAFPRYCLIGSMLVRLLVSVSGGCRSHYNLSIISNMWFLADPPTILHCCLSHAFVRPA